MSPPILASTTLEEPLRWVRTLDGSPWWVATAVYPDQVAGSPSPGDRVYVGEVEHVYRPGGAS